MKKTSHKSDAKATKTAVGRGRPKDPAKRDDIIRAASALFVKDGYELTSMEAVAHKAGVSKLTIYSHFANKVDLFRSAIYERCEKGMLPSTFMALADQPVEVGLTVFGSKLADLLYQPDSIKMNRVVFGEAVRHPKVIKIFYEAGPMRVQSAFGNLLQTWVDRGQLSIPDVPKAVEQFVSLIKGEKMSRVLLQITPVPDAAELERHVKASIAVFLSAYKTQAPKGAK